MVDLATETRIHAALDAGDSGGAVSVALREYGPRILSYQRAILRDESAAEEAFSWFSEFVWTGIDGFRRDAAFLTWAYRLAWTAVQRQLRDPFRKRHDRLDTHEMVQVVADAHSSASLFLAEQAPQRFAALRDGLTPEEQTLLILRIDRALGWREITEILGVPPERTQVAALRKRFERLKSRLRQRAEVEGLLRE